MLHAPSDHAPSPVAAEIKLSGKDVDILRSLASEIAQIASLPVHQEKADPGYTKKDHQTNS